MLAAVLNIATTQNSVHSDFTLNSVNVSILQCAVHTEALDGGEHSVHTQACEATWASRCKTRTVPAAIPQFS